MWNTALADGLKEAYGRVVYSHKVHEKQAERLVKTDGWLRVLQIVLLAITSGSALSVALGETHAEAIATAVFATISLVIEFAIRSLRLSDAVQANRQTAQQLWLLRERLGNLLCDIYDNHVDPSRACQVRDNLTAELAATYASAPHTSKASYKAAQRALKVDGEMSFAPPEIDALLPAKLRG